MQQQGGGVIVNIASIAGRAAGLRDRSAYVASKTGLIGFTKECAREFAAYNVRVNAVCPGVILTEAMCQTGLVALGIYLLGLELPAEEVAKTVTLFTESNVAASSPAGSLGCAKAGAVQTSARTTAPTRTFSSRATML